VAAAAARTGDTARLSSLVASMTSQAPAPGAADAAAVALSRVAVALHMAGRGPEGEALLARVEHGLSGPDPAVRARASVARSFSWLGRGEIYPALIAVSQAAAAFEQFGDLRSAANMRVNRAHLLAVLGDFATAETVVREALATSRRLGLHVVTVLGLVNLGSLLVRTGRAGEARAALHEALEQPGVQDDQRLTGSARVELAWCALLESDPATAEREAQAAVESTEGSPTIRAQALAVLSRARLAQSDAAEALVHAEEAHALLEKYGSAEGMDPEIRVVRAEALWATGQKDAARSAIDDAREKLLDRADRIPEESLRRSFLEEVPENARTLAFAAEWK